MILQKNYFSLNLFLIVITILFSFFLEYIFEILPCKICLYQRYLWVGLAVILLFSTFFLKKLVLIKISLVSINLIILLLLGIYHSGIELGYFNNIIKCSINSGFDANSIEELDKAIRNSVNNDCAFPKFKYFGLSLANMSSLLSLLLLIFNLIVFKKELTSYNEKKSRANR